MKNTLGLGGLARFAAAATALSAALGAQAHGDAPGHQAMPGGHAEAPFGRQGDPAQAARTIDVRMTDGMRFSPPQISVKRGETVRFAASNEGRLLHEMVLGTPGSLKAHAQAMRQHPGMAHAEANMVHVRPGGRGDMVWQFTEPGEFQYACLVPGHFEAGMVGTVTVR